MKQESHLKIKGVVVSRINGEVEFEVSRPVACEGCGACLSGTENRVRIPTDRNLHPGDTVWLLISCSAISGVSFLLYFIPAVCALLGFFTGYLWMKDLGGFLGAIIFLGLGYLGIKKFSRNKYNHSINIEETG